MGIFFVSFKYHVNILGFGSKQLKNDERPQPKPQFNYLQTRPTFRCCY